MVDNVEGDEKAGRGRHRGRRKDYRRHRRCIAMTCELEGTEGAVGRRDGGGERDSLDLGSNCFP